MQQAQQSQRSEIIHMVVPTYTNCRLIKSNILVGHVVKNVLKLKKDS